MRSRGREGVSKTVYVVLNAGSLKAIETIPKSSKRVIIHVKFVTKL